MFTKPDATKVVCNASKIYHKKLANKNCSDFYRKCLSNNLSEDDFTFKEDGTTDQKLKALPQIVNFFQMSKMTTLYSNTQPRLYTERLAGNVTACVGFIVDDNNGYYVPNTCLLQDIRTLGAPTNQILAILSKPASKEYSLYSTIEYHSSFSSSVRLAKAFCSLSRFSHFSVIFSGSASEFSSALLYKKRSASSNGTST